MSRNLRKICSLVAALSIASAIANPVSAQQAAMITVTADRSQGLTDKAPSVQVWAGRATAIDFSQIGERIVQVFLADPSRIVYASDAPVESGMATTVFLRQISPLNFPNLTRAYVTNLFVKTQASNGQLHLHTFNVMPGQKQPTYSGIAIAPARRSAGSLTTLQVGSSRPATLEDIERGLLVALRQGYTSAADPVVNKVRDFLAIARNETGSRSLVEIAQGQQLSPAVLTQLGQMGIESLATPPSRQQVTPIARAVANPNANVAPVPRPSAVPVAKLTPVKKAIAPTTAQRATVTNLPLVPIPPKVASHSVLPSRNRAERAPVVASSTTRTAKFSQSTIDDMNALRRGLQVARSKKQLNYGTTKWKQAQTAIVLLGQGKSREAAARKAGLPIEILAQLIQWGQ
jgi:hypothetical protein